MSKRDRAYNASPKGIARKLRYRSANREAVLLYGRRYYRAMRLRELRAALAHTKDENRRSELRSATAKLLKLIRYEGKKW